MGTNKVCVFLTLVVYPQTVLAMLIVVVVLVVISVVLVPVFIVKLGAVTPHPVSRL